MSSVPKERRGLGRGLEVLLGEGSQPELLHLPVETIHPNPRQPRRRFEPEAAAGLAASIKLQGVLQPVVVRRRQEGGYELIAGERRWRAAQAAGTPTLPALVRDVGDRDSLLLGLVENVAREQLSAGRGGACVRLARRRVRALARRRGGRESGGRSRPSRTGCVSSSSPRTCSGCSRAETSRKATRAQSCLCPMTTRAGGSRAGSCKEGMTVRGAERAAQNGGAEAAPASHDRLRSGARRACAGRGESVLTGLRSRVTNNTLEIRFDDETALAELVETLEAAA